jgi:hypothetical protein
MGQGCWPSGYSGTQSEAVRATNLAQIMIYERYNPDETFEFQQLDGPRQGEAGVRSRCGAWIRKPHLQTYGQAQSRTIRGTTSSALICTGHWGRCGGFTRRASGISQRSALHSRCPQRRLHTSRGDRTSSSPAHSRPIAAMVFSLPSCAALHRNAQPWLLSGRRRSSDRRRAVRPRLRPVTAPTDEWSQSGGCRPPW